MKYNVGKSMNLQAEACVEEVCRQFSNPKLILYYSQGEQFETYTKLLHNKYPESICMGATTLVNINQAGADKKGLMAVGIESGITCCADVLEDANKYPIKYVDRIERCVKEVGNIKDTLCLEFTTAFCCAEESVLSALNSVLLDKKIPIFGGTAGDDISSTTTLVGLNGKVYQNSAVFALIHNESGAIHFYRENIYKPVSGNTVTATKVDYLNRKVKEFDHKPAQTVYAKELGIPESQIQAHFDTNPMGRVFGDDLYITANCTQTADKGITYHARIYNNYKMTVLEPDDYKKVTQTTIEKIKREVPNHSFVIMCHCLARTLLYDGNGYLQEYVKKMGSVLGDYIGFSGYGEQLNRQHFNQTMTLAVFE